MIFPLTGIHRQMSRLSRLILVVVVFVMPLRGDDSGSDISRYGYDFAKHVSLLRKTGLDVVFVFDSTGSMGGAIQAAKQQIKTIDKVISTLVPGYRMGLYSYRDATDTYLVKGAPLSTFREEAISLLGSTQAGGGGDFPEGVQEAFEEVFAEAGFRDKAVKIIFLIGDAPSHDTAKLIKTIERANKGLKPFDADAVREYGDRLKPMFVINPLQVPLRSFGGKSHPMMKKTTEEYAQIAEVTGGLHVPLESAEAVTGPMLTLVFGDKYKEAIDKAIADVKAGKLVAPLDIGPLTRDQIEELILGDPQHAMPLILGFLEDKGDASLLPIESIYKALRRGRPDNIDQRMGLTRLLARHGDPDDLGRVLEKQLRDKSTLVKSSALRMRADLPGGRREILEALNERDLLQTACDIIVDKKWTGAVETLMHRIKVGDQAGNAPLFEAIYQLTGIRLLQGTPQELKKLKSWIQKNT